MNDTTHNNTDTQWIEKMKTPAPAPIVAKEKLQQMSVEEITFALKQMNSDYKKLSDPEEQKRLRQEIIRYDFERIQRASSSVKNEGGGKREKLLIHHGKIALSFLLNRMKILKIPTLMIKKKKKIKPFFNIIVDRSGLFLFLAQ